MCGGLSRQLANKATAEPSSGSVALKGQSSGKTRSESSSRCGSRARTGGNGTANAVHPAGLLLIGSPGTVRYVGVQLWRSSERRSYVADGDAVRQEATSH